MKSLLIITLACSVFFFGESKCNAQNNSQTDGKFLIVLDIQEYSTCNSHKLSETEAQKIIDSVNYVINQFNPNNVVYIRSSHDLLNLSLSYPFIYVSHDTIAMRLDKRMHLVNDRVFTKEKTSAFTLAELNDFLQQNKAKEIAVVGLLAEECVYETVVAGRDLGYEMYIVPEAIIGKSEKSKMKVLTKLKNNGIRQFSLNDK
ncbi:MAG: hypothetical protein CVT99_15840 [Bacteroidetes bacterium HGW-Bacteroidetes-16]|jgi:nicotinamidase-related amidase|nr:MAG: hypothetical protein CVT99_15840 [Bacteroidetes bacterium HGW-Bacteroidetes-16]